MQRAAQGALWLLLRSRLKLGFKGAGSARSQVSGWSTVLMLFLLLSMMPYSFKNFDNSKWFQSVWGLCAGAVMFCPGLGLLQSQKIFKARRPNSIKILHVEKVSGLRSLVIWHLVGLTLSLPHFSEFILVRS